MTCASFIFFAAVRIAQPSPGLAVDDLIVYTHDVTEFGADRQGKADSTAAIQSALDAAALGTALAEKLLAEGGAEILQELGLLSEE